MQPLELGGSEKQDSSFLGTSAFKIINLGPWQAWQSWGLHRAGLFVTKTVHQSAAFRFAQTFLWRWKSRKQICCAVVGTSLPCVSAQVQIEGDFLACSFSILEEQPMDMLLGLDMLKRHQVSKPLLKQLPGSCRFSEKCNLNALAVNSLGFSWGELMVDYFPAWKHVHYIHHGQL